MINKCICSLLLVNELLYMYTMCTQTFYTYILPLIIYYDNIMVVITVIMIHPGSIYGSTSACMFCTLFRSVKYRHTERDGMFRPYSVPWIPNRRSQHVDECMYIYINMSCTAVNGFLIYCQIVYDYFTY